MTTLYEYAALQKQNDLMKKAIKEAISYLNMLSNYETEIGGLEELIDQLKDAIVEEIKND